MPGMNEQDLQVLMVEDSDEDFIIIREWLGGTADRVFCLLRKETLEEGLEELRKGHTDVVLLDLSLPDCDGLETLLRVRAQVQDVPIIVLTGLADQELAIQAIHRGAQDYLVKGRADADRLSHALRYAMERHRVELTLRRYRDHLETLVHARTTELRKANRELDREVRERRQAEEERTRLHEQLSDARKLEALGRIAEGVAHEFNNSLMMINGYGELLKSKLPQDDSVQQDLTRLIEAGERATSLTQKLLAFSRKQVLNPEVISLHDLLEGGAQAIRPLLDGSITLRTEHASQSVSVKADRSQIEQVLVNLAGNACDAMPEGGELTLRAETVMLDRTPDGPTGAAVRYARLSVEDTGRGIDEGLIETIFEPFFSTKQDNRPGLGLSVAYGIMRMHGGWVAATAREGGGSVLSLYLPAVPAEQETRTTAGRRAPANTARRNR